MRSRKSPDSGAGMTSPPTHQNRLPRISIPDSAQHKSALGSLYRGRETRDWLKTKCHQTGEFVITGFEELGEGRREAVYVAEEIGGALKPAGRIQFGFAGKGLWSDLDALRSGPARRGIVPVEPMLRAE